MSKNNSRYNDPEYQKQVSTQMLATPTLEIACRAITDLRQRVKDLEYLYDVINGPKGDGGKFNYLMEQLEGRFFDKKKTSRTKENIDSFLAEIDKSVVDSTGKKVYWRTGDLS